MPLLVSEINKIYRSWTVDYIIRIRILKLENTYVYALFSASWLGIYLMYVQFCDIFCFNFINGCIPKSL